MGGHAWQFSSKYDSNPKQTFEKHKNEIQQALPEDWRGNVRFDERPFDAEDPSGFVSVRPIDSETLLALFETDKPTEEQVLGDYSLWEILDRGKGCYVVCYVDDKPDTICFMGYSFD